MTASKRSTRTARRCFRIAPALGIGIRDVPSGTDFCIGSNRRITRSLVNWHTRPADEIGLLDEASVELDKHLSMHPALRANRAGGRLGRKGYPTFPENCSLSLNGEFRFTGCDCLSMSAMHATTCELNLQPGRSSAFHVNNNEVRHPIPDQGSCLSY